MRQAQACEVLGLSERTLQRWQTGEVVHEDQRPLRDYQPPHKLTETERAEVLAVANADEFGHLPPSQIVPRLADQGRFIAFESTFYRILRAENQLGHRRSERPAQSRTKPRAVCATAPNQLYSWDITYLPSAIRGQFIYLYLFMDIFYPQGTRAGRSSVGRSMKRTAAPWQATCYATCASVRVSNPTN